MNTRLKFTIASLAAVVLSFGAIAQPDNGTRDGGITAAPPSAGGCAKARDPQRCEALQQAKGTCMDKTGADKRKCMTEAMPPMDCRKARNPAKCEAQQKARETCQEKSGRQHLQCMRDQTAAAAKRSRQAPPKN